MDAQSTNTIVIALITFASGAFGAVIGAFGSVYAAKITARRQLIQALFSSRIQAYRALLDSAVEYERNFNDLKMLADFYASVHAAELLASEPTRKAIADFKERMKDKDFLSDSTRSAREQMLNAMQQDLLNVPEIRIRKSASVNRSGRRWCKGKSTSQQRQSSR